MRPNCLVFVPSWPYCNRTMTRMYFPPSIFGLFLKDLGSFPPLFYIQDCDDPFVKIHFCYVIYSIILHLFFRYSSYVGLNSSGMYCL